MPQIIVSTPGGIADHALVASLRRRLPAGVGELAAALKHGTPLLQEELFVAEGFDQFVRLRRLIDALSSAGVEPLVCLDGHRVGVEVLHNML